MNLKTLIQRFIMQLIILHGKSIWTILHAKRNKFILDFMNNNILNIIKDHSLATKCYWFVHNIKEFPICHYCKKPIMRNVINARVGYSKYNDIHHLYCSTKCSKADPYSKEKTKLNMLKKYGVTSTNSLQSVKDKKKKTWINTYGCDNPAKSDKIKAKMSTTINNHRIENPNYFNEKNKKQQKTCLDKYGDPNYNNKEQALQTRLTRNNGQYFSNESKELMHKTRQLRNLTGKYVDSYKQSGQKRKIIALAKSYDRCINDQLCQPLFSKQYFLDNWTPLFPFTWKCLIHNIKFYSTWVDGSHKSCPLCISNGLSNGHKEIYYFLLNKTKNIISLNDRTIISPLELDIYVNNFAVEFNGLYWHSNKNSNYHLMKTKMCEEKNITLIHIWENELKDKNNQLAIEQHLLKQLNHQPFIFQDEIIHLDRCKYPLTTNIPGYIAIDEIPPAQHTINGFTYYDCGQLVYRRI